MANVNTLGQQAGKPPRQMRRQSRDFKEIWNIQSNMDVSDERWDSIYHNWENPKKCSNNRPGHKCIVCEEVARTGQYVNKTTGEIYDKNGKIKHKQTTK